MFQSQPAFRKAADIPDSGSRGSDPFLSAGDGLKGYTEVFLATVGHKVAGMNADLGHKPPLRAATGCGGSGDIAHSQTPSGSQP